MKVGEMRTSRDEAHANNRKWGNEHHEIQNETESDFGGRAASMLGDVSRVISQRGEKYGDPSDHHTKTAAILSVLWGMRITAEEVCLTMAVDKLVRDSHIPTWENRRDIIGWLCCLEDHHRRGAAE